MSFITVPHTPGPYGLLLDIQEPLLACLSLLLLAVACYLLVPGVARCVQLVRASTGAARPSPAWNAAVPARLRAARPSAPLSLLSAPDQPRAPLAWPGRSSCAHAACWPRARRGNGWISGT